MGVAKYIYIWSVRTELSLSPVSLIIHTKSSQHRHTHTHTHWPACLPACLPSTHMNTGMLAMHKSYKNLNTRWFTNLFFILLSLPATHTHTHTHTHTLWTPGTDCNASASLVVGEEGWGIELRHTFNILRPLLYTVECFYERNSLKELCVCLCVCACVCVCVCGAMCGTLESHPRPHQSEFLFLFNFEG